MKNYNVIPALVRETVRDVVVPVVVAGIAAYASIRVAAISKVEKPDEKPQD